MRFVLTLMTAFSGVSASACDNGQERHFSCSFENGAKWVEVCIGADTGTYSFGHINAAPEMVLVRPVSDIGLVPWPGIGRTIWEEVSFQNEGHRYVVYAAIERALPEDGEEEITATVSGGIAVTHNSQEIARLRCDPGSVEFPWGTTLFDAKSTAGQCYDRSTRSWANCEHNLEGD